MEDESMLVLATGLSLFFGTHFYSAFRNRTPETDIKETLGYGRFMLLYSLVSGIGFALIIYGYASTPATELLYSTPSWTYQLQLAANLIASLLIVAAYVPSNRLKEIVRHPMIIGVAVWAGAHLFSATDTKEALLFGSFFVFGVVDSVASLRRPFTPSPSNSIISDLIVLAGGIAFFAAMNLWGHEALIGVVA
ncbi:MAG: NnrU family protein [Pseudomonadota bacterium]